MIALPDQQVIKTLTGTHVDLYEDWGGIENLPVYLGECPCGYDIYEVNGFSHCECSNCGSDA